MCLVNRGIAAHAAAVQQHARPTQGRTVPQRPYHEHRSRRGRSRGGTVRNRADRVRRVGTIDRPSYTARSAQPACAASRSLGPRSAGRPVCEKEADAARSTYFRNRSRYGHAGPCSQCRVTRRQPLQKSRHDRQISGICGPEHRGRIATFQLGADMHGHAVAGQVAGRCINPVSPDRPRSSFGIASRNRPFHLRRIAARAGLRRVGPSHLSPPAPCRPAPPPPPWILRRTQPHARRTQPPPGQRALQLWQPDSTHYDARDNQSYQFDEW